MKPLSVHPLTGALRAVSCLLPALACLTGPAQAEPFPANQSLGSLGTNGFRMRGAAGGDRAGEVVAGVGDVNGDGLGDALIKSADGTLGGHPGIVQVVLGFPGRRSMQLNLNSVGSGGFGLHGTNVALITTASSAGDINTDGVGDFALGAPNASFGSFESGVVYVVYGRSNSVTNIDLDTMGLSTGFIIHTPSAGDRLGESLAPAGDANNGSGTDLIIGAPGSDFNGTDSGAAYVLFGRTSLFPSPINLSTLPGVNRARLAGTEPGAYTGTSVSGNFDWDGDGISDLLIGSPVAASDVGVADVVRGGTNLFGNLNVVPASRISGTTPGNKLGYSAAALPDLNGDGFDDLAFGSEFGGTGNGELQVAFGSNPPRPTQQVPSGNYSFDFQVLGQTNRLGQSVSSLGDFNGDGLGDLVVGSQYGALVVMGRLGEGRNVNQTTIRGPEAFLLTPQALDDQAGAGVAGLGDFNGDGFADLLVGAQYADAGAADAGAAYLIYGKDAAPPALLSLNPPPGAIDVLTNAPLIMEFTEALVPGTNHLVLRRDIDDSLIASIAPTDSNVFISGSTLTISNALLSTAGQIYITNEPGALFDQSSNPTEPLETRTSWSFFVGATGMAGTTAGGGTAGSTSAGSSSAGSSSAGSSSAGSSSAGGSGGSATAGTATSGSNTSGTPTSGSSTAGGASGGGGNSAGGGTAGSASAGTSTSGQNTSGGGGPVGICPTNQVPGLEWEFNVKRPKDPKDKGLRFKPGKTGLGTARGLIMNTGLEKKSTNAVVQVAVVRAPLLQDIATNPCAVTIPWQNATKVSKVGSKGAAKFKLKNLVADQEFESGETFEVWFRAGTNFNASSSQLLRLPFRVR